jgi:hypothetical protein
MNEDTIVIALHGPSTFLPPTIIAAADARLISNLKDECLKTAEVCRGRAGTADKADVSPNRDSSNERNSP